MDEVPQVPEPSVNSPGASHAASPDLASDQRLENLVSLARGIVERQGDDPFGNPVLAMALLVSRRMDEGVLGLDEIHRLVCQLRDEAFLERAVRLRAYVAGADGEDMELRLGRIAARLIRPDPEDSPVPLAQFRAAVQRVR